jgi:hypothetical protein
MLIQEWLHFRRCRRVGASVGGMNAQASAVSRSIHQ